MGLDPVILRDREGMLVYRLGDSVVKEARDEENTEALANSYRFFRALEDTPYIPELLGYEIGKLTYRYEEDVPVTDTEAARRNIIRMLHVFRQRHIIHGDLTRPNLLFHKGNSPVALDWDQSIFTHEPKPQKRPKSDAAHVWPAVVEKAGDPSRVIQRWIACMPHLEKYFGWGNLLDLGTHMGDFPAIASAQGLKGEGVDDEYIRPCIQESRDMWGRYGCIFYKEDIVSYLQQPDIYSEIIMMFSTWPYIVQQQGKEVADQVLQRCVDSSSVFLFETQYAGDGPGPDFLKNDEDAVDYLSKYGETTKVITLPVPGRESSRTVWKIE